MSDSLERFLENHPALNRQGDQEYTRAIWGGIAQEYDVLRTNILAASVDTVAVETTSGDLLNELAQRYTGIPQISGEDDSTRLKLMYAFFRRGGKKSWATKHSIMGAFSYYFPIASIHILENAVETNLLLEGSFEGFDLGVKSSQFGEWIPTGSQIEVVSGESFEGAKSVRGTGTGAVSQTVSVLSGYHILETAYKGRVGISITRGSDGYFWNPDTKGWQSASLVITKQSVADAYELSEIPVKAEAIDTITVTYSVLNPADTFDIDYLSFGVKPSYPFIRILIATFGQGGDYLNNWPGTIDPVAGTDYENATYFGLDYIGGEGSGVPTTYYQTILDYVKPAGVKAMFEFIGRT